MNLEVFCSDQQVVKKIMKIFPLKFENKLQSCYILESLRRRIVTHISNIFEIQNICLYHESLKHETYGTTVGLKPHKIFLNI